MQAPTEAPLPTDISLSMNMGCLCLNFVMNVEPNIQSHKPSIAPSVELRDYSIYVLCTCIVYAHVCMCVCVCVYVRAYVFV